MVRALVTGGHGFLGSHVVDRLLAEGAEVRALYRRPGRPAVFEGKPVELVRGDIRDRAALARAAEGVDEVYHLAGLTRALTRRQMLETNTEGTRRLLGALAETGFTGRFVLCSSLSAVGRSCDGVPLDELAPTQPMSWYGESKLAAETLLWTFGDRFHVVALRPPGVYGPRDTDFLGLFQAVSRGFAPVLGSLGHRYSMIHVRDVARAHVDAARARETAGRAYMVAHRDPVSGEDIVAAAEQAVGRRARRIVLPASLVRLVGEAVELGSQLTGRASILGRERIRELASAHWVCDPGALERDAGWSATLALGEGFRDTADWYRAQGLLADRGRPRRDR